jgi:hypothetical protein
MSVQKGVTTVTVMPLVVTLMGASSASVMLATAAMALKGTAQMWTSVQTNLAITMPLAPIPSEVLSALVILAFLVMASTAVILTNAVTLMEDVVRIAQTQWEASFVSVNLDTCSPTKQSVLILMNVRATSPCV